MTTIGTPDDAFEAHLASFGYAYAEEIGRGERRIVYLINGVAYKCGPPGVNRYEHEVFTAWREAGAAWAPETSLHSGADGHGFEYTIVAMTYLPHDGTDRDPVMEAEIRRYAPQTCGENMAMVDGHLYLIDGEDVEYMP